MLEGLNDSWFNADGSYNTSYAPNAIDPELFYDEDGQLWMNYGSWSGGVYILKINDTRQDTPIYPGKDSDNDTLNLTDRYFGIEYQVDIQNQVKVRKLFMMKKQDITI